MEELEKEVERLELSIKAYRSRTMELMEKLNFYKDKCRKLEKELRDKGVRKDFDL